MTEKIVGSKMPANNGYGQNGDCSASSSIGIAESSKLCGLDIGVPDEALDRLVSGGMPSDLAAFQGPTGQERPISDTPFPARMARCASKTRKLCSAQWPSNCRRATPTATRSL